MPRRRCPRCRSSSGVLPDGAVRGYVYGRQVIEHALALRRRGASWEKCAAACTADGLVATSVVRRWARLLGWIVTQQPAPFQSRGEGGILAEPDGSGVETFNNDPWERSPPIHL